MNVTEAIKKSTYGIAIRRDVTRNGRQTWYHAWIEQEKLKWKRMENKKKVPKARNFNPFVYGDWVVRN